MTIPTFKIIIVNVLVHIKESIDITDTTKLTISREKKIIEEEKCESNFLDTFDQLNPA